MINNKIAPDLEGPFSPPDMSPADLGEQLSAIIKTAPDIREEIQIPIDDKERVRRP